MTTTHANWFAGLFTVADVKLTYRKLCSIHHPDRGGQTSTMQDINVGYHKALERLDGFTYTGNDNETHTYHYYQKREQALMDIVYAVCGLDMPDDVDIQIIGSWLWVTGNTKPHSKRLGRQKGGLGLNWHKNRSAWYWHVPSKRRTKYNSAASLDDLAQSYGSQSFNSANNGNGNAAEREEHDRRVVFDKR